MDGSGICSLGNVKRDGSGIGSWMFREGFWMFREGSWIFREFSGKVHRRLIPDTGPGWTRIHELHSAMTQSLEWCCKLSSNPQTLASWYYQSQFLGLVNILLLQIQMLLRQLYLKRFLWSIMRENLYILKLMYLFGLWLPQFLDLCKLGEWSTSVFPSRHRKRC